MGRGNLLMRRARRGGVDGRRRRRLRRQLLSPPSDSDLPGRGWSAERDRTPGRGADGRHQQGSPARPTSRPPGQHGVNPVGIVVVTGAGGRGGGRLDYRVAENTQE